MRLAMALRNRLIDLGFKSAVRWSQLRRRLGQLGHAHLSVVDHLTVPVRDLERARAFYCELLGGALFMTLDDAALARFGRPPAPDGGEMVHHHSVYFNGATRIDLFLQHSGQAQPLAGHPHLAFRTTPRQMRRWKALLESRGIPVDGPIQLGPPGQASMYFNDPFGNHLEITCMGYAEPIEIRAPVMERLTWKTSEP